MEVTNSVKNGCSIYYFEKKMDIFNAERIRKFLIDSIKENDYKKVIFNFKKLRDIDSIGIAILIKINNTFKDDVNIRFCELNDNVSKALNYTHIKDFFEIDKTEEESIDEFGNL